jgi:hypothetical protein
LFNNKQDNKKQEINRKRNRVSLPELRTHCDTLDQGTNAFIQWLSSEDKKSTTTTTNDPIILKEFVNNNYTVLYDTNLGHDVIVETHDGVPRCKSCNADDCGHVGFTICVEQKYDNDGTIFD